MTERFRRASAWILFCRGVLTSEALSTDYALYRRIVNGLLAVPVLVGFVAAAAVMESLPERWSCNKLMALLGCTSKSGLDNLEELGGEFGLSLTFPFNSCLRPPLGPRLS